MTWLIATFGERAARFIVALGVALIIGAFVLFIAWRSHDDTPSEQAKQTTRSSEAVADAAQDAIATIGKRTATDALIDDVTVDTVKEIENAVDPFDVRDAVVAGVCRNPAHRRDPACAVR